MSKRKKRTAYPHEFKKKAVKMTTKEGITVSDVADELGVSAQCLSRWRRELIEDSDLGLAEKRLDAMSENKKLKDENKQLKIENEILKKAASYFASQK